MKATLSNCCSLSLQRQIMKQANTFETNVNTQVGLIDKQMNRFRRIELQTSTLSDMDV